MADRTGGWPAVPATDNSRITGGEPPDNVASIARDATGRFVKGASGNPARLFAKGRSGNPRGRPKGRFRAGTRAAAALLDKEAPALAAKAVELALGGDAVAVRFCLGRLLGVRRGQPVELGMPAVTYPDDVRAAVAAITEAVGAGGVTPDEARALAQVLETVPRVFAALPLSKPEPTKEQADAARHSLIDALDRLANRYTNEERRAMLEEELAALDAESDKPAP